MLGPKAVRIEQDRAAQLFVKMTQQRLHDRDSLGLRLVDGLRLGRFINRGDALLEDQKSRLSAAVGAIATRFDPATPELLTHPRIRVSDGRISHTKAEISIRHTKDNISLHGQGLPNVSVERRVPDGRAVVKLHYLTPGSRRSVFGMAELKPEPTQPAVHFHQAAADQPYDLYARGLASIPAGQREGLVQAVVDVSAALLAIANKVEVVPIVACPELVPSA